MYDTYSEQQWEEFRASAMNLAKNRNESVLKKWFTECNLTFHNITIAYENDYKTFTIYTTRPGALIGYKGTNVEILKRLLLEEFNIEYEILFREIRGRFFSVSVNHVY